MILALMASAVVAQSVPDDSGYSQLVAGNEGAAISTIERAPAVTFDPAQLINLGVAYARTGDFTKARTLFARAYRSREWVELETANGSWVDSRALAQQALATLDSGGFARGGHLARK